MSTYRDPSGWQVELGAMRIPNSHLLVGTFIKEIFKLETRDFSHFDPETYIYVNGIRVKTKDYLKNPDILGYETMGDEKGRTAEELLDMALKPFVREIQQHGWKIFLEKYDGLNLRQSLTAEKNFSSAALSMMSTLNNIGGFFDYALTEVLEIFYDIIEGIRFYCITAGNDLLPKALLAALNMSDVTFNARVVKISQAPDHVTVEYLSQGGLENTSGDFVLMTTNPVAMSFMEFKPPLSFKKRAALQQMQSDCSAKLVLSFSERFWEKEGIFGGKTITDLPSHVLYYMTGGSNFTGGVVVSYTWAMESCWFAGMGKDELLEMVLSNLVTIHGEHVRTLFTGGIVKHWSLDSRIFGAYAYYSPFQRLQIHKDLEEPCGRIWFAGEYINVPHAWMETAVKSALRTAVYLNTDIQEE